MLSLRVFGRRLPCRSCTLCASFMAGAARRAVGPLRSAHQRHRSTAAPRAPDTQTRCHSFATPGQYVPYGLANFRTIREEGMFFKDNSAVLRKLEKVKHGLLVRPPRFGKSLLLSMVREYYDVLGAGDVEQLFAGLAVGKTPERSSFMVLPLDFSLDVDDMEIRDVRRLLYDSINFSVEDFSLRYNMAVDVNPANAMISLRRCAAKVRAQGGKLMVLVDEYDRFANKLMLEKYRRLVAGQSGAGPSSPIRSFFETLKRMEWDMGTSFRSLTVGISPIALADASGANTLQNLTLKGDYGDVCGFTEADLRRCLQEMEIPDLSPRGADKAIKVMTEYYNGYRFPGSTTSLFNPTLSLDFLQKFGDNSNGFRDAILQDQFTPDELIDKNVEVSENVLRLLDHTPGGLTALQRLLLGQLFVDRIEPILKLRQLVEPHVNTKCERAVGLAASFLYYHGAATLQHSSYRPGVPTSLVIPNQLQKHSFVEEAEGRTESVRAWVQRAFGESSLEVQVVADAVQTVMRNNPALLDLVSWNETAVQVLLAEHLAVVFGPDAVRCEVWAGPKGGGSKRTDIVVCVGTGRYVALELMRPQPSDYIFMGFHAKKSFLRETVGMDQEKLMDYTISSESVRVHMVNATKQIIAWNRVRQETNVLRVEGVGDHFNPLAEPSATVDLLALVVVGGRVVARHVQTDTQAVSHPWSSTQ